MKLIYKEIRFQAGTLERIDQANEIINEYLAQGYKLTLRQIYYQFVAKGLIPNTQRSYKALGSIINDGRMAGLIDWNAIEDRTRNLAALAHWDEPADIIDACAKQFRIDRWETQTYRPEVWIEKEALAGVFEQACETYDVPYFACRGYVSQSEQWAAGRRFKRYAKAGQQPIVLHFGDHDPSGIDMTRDNLDRLEVFAECPVELRRLALNFDQIEEYDPPPNPAKVTDSRFEGYCQRFGEDSWELDALTPRVLVELVQDEIQSLIDEDEWQASRQLQDEHRDTLRQIAEDLRS